MGKFGSSLPPGCSSTPGEEEYDERHPFVQWLDYKLGCTISLKNKRTYDGMGIGHITGRVVRARLFNLIALDWSGHRHSWMLQLDCKHPFSRTPVHAETAHTILRIILGKSVHLTGFRHKGDRYRSMTRLSVLTEKPKAERDPKKPRWEEPLRGRDIFVRYSGKINPHESNLF